MVKFLKKRKIEPTPKKIGILGLGKISRGIMRNAHRSGHSVIMWNQARMQCEDFARAFQMQILDSPAKVIEAAEITFCCVSDFFDFEQFVKNNCGSLKKMSEHGKRKGFVDMTSMDPRCSKCICKTIETNGGRYLEASLIRSKIDAGEGTLLILTAGDESLYEECKNCFDDISKSHLFVGHAVETASKLRLSHNMLTDTMYDSVAEALALVKEIEYNGESFLNSLKNNDNIQNICDEGLALIKTKYVRYDSSKQTHRDLSLGLLLSKRLQQVTSPIFDAANEVYNLFKNNNSQTMPPVQFLDDTQQIF